MYERTPTFYLGELFMSTLKKILIVVILTVVPIVIGLPFTLGFGNKVIMEVTLAVFGLLELLVFMFRMRMKDKKLYKDAKTNKEFKETEEYGKYINIQYLIFISAIINIVLSVLYFYIFLTL